MQKKSFFNRKNMISIRILKIVVTNVTIITTMKILTVIKSSLEILTANPLNIFTCSKLGVRCVCLCVCVCVCVTVCMCLCVR